MEVEETADHLFLACVFSREVWTHFINSLNILLPPSMTELISNWMALSPFSLRKKNLPKICWMWLPNFLSWKLWLERNNRIFHEESRTPPQVAIKIKSMMGEVLSTKNSIKNSEPLN
jgi:hypothetical protein